MVKILGNKMYLFFLFPLRFSWNSRVGVRPVRQKLTDYDLGVRAGGRVRNTSPLIINGIPKEELRQLTKSEDSRQHQRGSDGLMMAVRWQRQYNVQSDKLLAYSQSALYTSPGKRFHKGIGALLATTLQAEASS